MGNDNKGAMEYFSSVEGKQAIQNMRDSIANTADEIRNLSMPTFHYDVSTFQPRLPQNNLAEKFNELIRLNEQSNDTNKEISGLLSSAQLEISSLKNELGQIKKSQKYNWVKEILIGLFCAIAGAYLGHLFNGRRARSSSQ